MTFDVKRHRFIYVQNFWLPFCSTLAIGESSRRAVDLRQMRIEPTTADET